MNVFNHHLYEYRKGLRNLILHTTRRSFYERIVKKLENAGVDYIIYPVNSERINVFFGEKDCVDVVRRIGKMKLAAFSAEEDFILGIMLGYDRLKQCQRYLKTKNSRASAGSFSRNFAPTFPV
jgi:hypothetical protein